MNKMSFEELKGILDYCIVVGQSPLLPEGVIAYKELIISHYAELQAYKADIENAIKGAMDDNPDEKHCSCVPLFKNHQRQIADLEAQVEQGKRAIELVKKCDEYLDSFYKINSIRTSCSLHIKMKELLQPDGLTKGERG